MVWDKYCHAEVTCLQNALRYNVLMLIPDDLPFEFKALELALELSCTSLDSQVCVVSSRIVLWMLSSDSDSCIDFDR